LKDAGRDEGGVLAEAVAEGEVGVRLQPRRVEDAQREPERRELRVLRRDEVVEVAVHDEVRDVDPGGVPHGAHRRERVAVGPRTPDAGFERALAGEREDDRA